MKPSRSESEKQTQSFFLKVLKHDLELAEVKLRQGDIAIGRSPTCEAILRDEGVAPIEFLVSSAGADEWMVFQLGDNVKEKSMVSLRPRSVESFGGYTFRVEQRLLQGSDYKAKVFEENIKKSGEVELLIDPKKWILEAAVINHSKHAPEDVVHISSGDSVLNKGFYPFQGLPIKVTLGASDSTRLKLNVDSSLLTGAELYKQGIKTKDMFFQLGELYQIVWMSRSYYFRFMNAIICPPLEKGRDGDKLMSQLLSWFFLPLLLLLLISFFIVEPDPVVPKEPKRVAKIEVPPLPQNPVPLEPPVVPKANPIQTSGSNAANPSRAAPSRNRSTRSRTQSQSSTANAQPNSPTPPAPTPEPKRANAVGLLGALGGSESVAINQDQFRGNTAAQSRPQVKGNVGSGGAVLSRAELSQRSGPQGGQQFQGQDTRVDVGQATQGEGGGYIVGSGVGASRGQNTGNTGVGEARVEDAGGLDKETVRRVIRQYEGAVRHCYNRALGANPGLKGRVVMEFVIQPGGSVPQAKVASSELGSPAVESCVRSIIQRMVFPRAPNQRPTYVKYPFVFHPTN